ncbi:hypothetical protein PMZ80_006799 [Knufia obscura]|uniref:Major facilitator superfamily (MFS) profile domain-containing protein n=2 Tax=Knufia TaxID=430999 RepID=A0AAN8E7R1_9EURO|nr:hypothetical protein PMZ80_006799 [Knufia obscura]KAK5948119.1 hypothetical protein OHC33_010867 [Knufia fluminis]
MDTLDGDSDSQPINTHKSVARISDVDEVIEDENYDKQLEGKIRRKVDLRLCTIAGILCSLNLLDSGIISSAAVTSMPQDLGLTGNRFSVAIFIFTVASICAQLPATILMRFIGPPIFFGCATVAFGLITLCTAFIHSWREMIALRVLLGISMSGIYPGLTYLISTWYARSEQGVRFAFLQSGEVIILATGSIVNFGLNQLHGQQSLAGWRWMYIVQGSITMFLGVLTFFWIPDFPERAAKTTKFLTQEEIEHVLAKIDRDRKDAGKPEPFTVKAILLPFFDPKLYAFAVLFFLLNLVSTALSYFLPIILQSGMGFSSNKAILLSAPPYYYAVIPVLLSSFIGDKFRIRGPIIIFNALCLIIGFCMLGFPSQVTVRYIGTFLATGAYVSNWAALSTYQANNITGQWKRATVAAAISACNGLGGIAGSYIVKSPEAPRYLTAIWVSIGSHLLMISVVLVCTSFFRRANRRARKGKGTIEGVIDFRYTY